SLTHHVGQEYPHRHSPGTGCRRRPRLRHRGPPGRVPSRPRLHRPRLHGALPGPPGRAGGRHLRRRVRGCGYEDIQYPATFENYCASAGAGVKNGIAQLTAYAKRCPSAKLVLTGYSQGGHVVGDILGGGGGNFQGCTQATTPALSPSSSPGNQIAAALFFGDVRHTPNQAYNVGSAPKSANGIWPRTGSGLSALNAFSSKLQSWCDAGDPACASGNNGQVHTGYFQKYVPDAAAWAKTKL
ncbi:acetylxylan esterase 2, partial [Apiospora arundinis]